MNEAAVQSVVAVAAMLGRFAHICNGEQMLAWVT